METLGPASPRICCTGEIARETLLNKVEWEMTHGSCPVHLCTLPHRWVNMAPVLEILGCSFTANYQSRFELNQEQEMRELWTWISTWETKEQGMQPCRGKRMRSGWRKTEEGVGGSIEEDSLGLSWGCLTMFWKMSCAWDEATGALEGPVWPLFTKNFI